jgi:hypothetical protein
VARGGEGAGGGGVAGRRPAEGLPAPEYGPQHGYKHPRPYIRVYTPYIRICIIRSIYPLPTLGTTNCWTLSRLLVHRPDTGVKWAFAHGASSGNASSLYSYMSWPVLDPLPEVRMPPCCQCLCMAILLPLFTRHAKHVCSRRRSRVRCSCTSKKESSAETAGWVEHKVVLVVARRCASWWRCAPPLRARAPLEAR